LVDNDPRTVLTLDAGGTNLVFSALRSGEEVAGPLILPSRGDSLDGCLANILRGLEEVLGRAGGGADAIACGFPGPADYPSGVVGPQKNLPCIREPLALGTILHGRFGIPTYLFNDADLFVHGEARGGFLPWVNDLIEDFGPSKRYRSLFGITLGTGLGAGYTLEGRMVTGDHGGGPEIWCIPSGPDPSQPAEEYASARAVVRSYGALTGVPADEVPEPRTLFDIAEGRAAGNSVAAREAFRRLGEAAGHAAAQAISLFDCPLVVGGGLSGAGSIILPALVKAMNGNLEMVEGKWVSQLDGRAFNLEAEEGRGALLREVGSRRRTSLGGEKALAVEPRLFPAGITRLGTSRAASLGAYAAAIEALDRDR
jgi:glucokinase